MPAGSYQKGRALEYQAKAALEQQGWKVIRSAGSHSPADLVALKQGKVWLIQVQTRSHLPSEKERALKAFAQACGQEAYLLWRAKGQWWLRRVYPEQKEAPIPAVAVRLSEAE